MIVGDNNVSQVICLNCYRRWIAARPVTTWLDELECPTCHQSGFAIETGEICDSAELLKQAYESQHNE